MGTTCSKSDSDHLNNPNRPQDLTDFKIVRAIGKGAFGKVSIVEHRRTKKYYALKYMEKKSCVNERAVQHIVQERNLLEEIHHPFVIQLRYSFQDWEYLFMVIDLAMGGDLRFHCSAKSLREPAIRIIVAEISSALQYLHLRKIVHRDIKPDNILLDEQGHAYLTDFNIAVKTVDGKPLKSQAGTEPCKCKSTLHIYPPQSQPDMSIDMAPEILHGTGYYTSPDWWSLGILTYELTFHDRPFRGPKKKDLIRKNAWSFPKRASSRASPALQSLISQLLEPDLSKRLGVDDEGRRRLRDHAFFEGLGWEELERKEVKPEFVPSKEKSNFDATYDLEELLLNDRPLVSKRRKKPKGWDETPEMKTFEELYLYYDWENPQRNRSSTKSTTQLDYEPPVVKRSQSLDSVSGTLRPCSELETVSSIKSSNGLGLGGASYDTMRSEKLAQVEGSLANDDGVGALHIVGRPVPGLQRRPSSVVQDMGRNYSMTEGLLNSASRRGSHQLPPA
ncbi:hypothetical protein HK097_009750 [Rhizophlyctis rosea]|uniref:Uncharacterized protein n=1 Tax=Rhizophlyctis rosea TaxID=64517 RepID=A0AAD5SBJ5_9FUNG|nr:hypothetical protein HK097_009750 [Rhizophlyctis rosea]